MPQTLYNKNKMMIPENRSKGGLEDIFMVSVDSRKDRVLQIVMNYSTHTA